MTAILPEVGQRGSIVSPTGKVPLASERPFIDWLIEQGYELEYEPHALQLPPRLTTRKRHDHRPPRSLMQVSRPDLWIRGLPDGRTFSVDLGPRIYIELTAPELAQHPTDLPEAVRRRNLTDSESLREHLPPEEYLFRKQQRAALIEQENPSVRVIVLNLTMQRAWMHCPEGLLEMIERQLVPYALLQPA